MECALKGSIQIAMEFVLEIVNFHVLLVVIINLMPVNHAIKDIFWSKLQINVSSIYHAIVFSIALIALKEVVTSNLEVNA